MSKDNKRPDSIDKWLDKLAAKSLGQVACEGYFKKLLGAKMGCEESKISPYDELSPWNREAWEAAADTVIAAMVLTRRTGDECKRPI